MDFKRYNNPRKRRLVDYLKRFRLAIQLIARAVGLPSPWVVFGFPLWRHRISWPGGYGPWDNIIPFKYRPDTRYFTKLGMKLPDIRRTKGCAFLEKITKSDDSNPWRDALTPYPEGSCVIASCRHTSLSSQPIFNLQLDESLKLIGVVHDLFPKYGERQATVKSTRRIPRCRSKVLFISERS